MSRAPMSRETCAACKAAAEDAAPLLARFRAEGATEELSRVVAWCDDHAPPPVWIRRRRQRSRVWIPRKVQE